MTSWNNIPLDPETPKEEIADQFERQWEENKAAGEAKEQAGQYRPEPNGRGSVAR